MGRRIALLFLGFAWMLMSFSAYGHGIKTAYFEIIEGKEGHAVALWKSPVPSRETWPEVDGCELREVRSNEASSRFITRFTAQCEGGLAGRTIVVKGLGLSVNEAIARVQLANGKTVSQVLARFRSTWTIPHEPKWFEVFPRYAKLGIEHILTGFDHLLFVFGLVLVAGVRRWRTLLGTVTAFTVAHSLTLSATALGWLRVPSAPAEVTIAASLVLVALEVGHIRLDRTSQWMAFFFGLVHGFGFAGALAETGLPEGAVAPALLAFNLGVEVGQLAVVALVVTGIVVGARGLAQIRRGPFLGRVARAGAAYVIGVPGMFLFFERVASLMRP